MKTWQTILLLSSCVISWSALLISAQSSRTLGEFDTVRAKEFVLSDPKGMRVGTMTVRDGVTVLEMCTPGRHAQPGVVIECGEQGVEISLGRLQQDGVVQIVSDPNGSSVNLYVPASFGNSRRATLQANQKTGVVALEKFIDVETNGEMAPGVTQFLLLDAEHPGFPTSR